MRPGAWLLPLLPLAGCVSGPPPAAAVEPEHYRTARDPEGAAAWQRAQQALARGDRAAALPDLRIALERCPDLAPAHVAYQDAAQALGGEVLAAMREHYRSLPDRASPVPAWCRARLVPTPYAREPALRAVLARHPSFAWAHWSLGRSHRSEGRVLLAIDAFQAACARDPRLAAARYERALLLTEVGRYEEAALDFDAYLALEPHDDDARLAYTQLAIYRLGRIDRAVRLLDELERTRGGDVAVRLDRAAATWLGGDPRGAVARYLGVLADRPGEARALLNLGLLYYEVLPKSTADRAIHWPRARAAFQLFLQTVVPPDGHDQFERTLAVPFRLGVIAEALGPAPGTAPTLADLRLPEGP
ncbi:MAG: tetratricopeptide repeat protein [Planctomycetes bacterium]|nr:tetratricopeptide repeat protein [Planctomycetota bacterium]